MFPSVHGLDGLRSVVSGGLGCHTPPVLRESGPPFKGPRGKTGVYGPVGLRPKGQWVRPVRGGRPGASVQRDSRVGTSLCRTFRVSSSLRTRAGRECPGETRSLGAPRSLRVRSPTDSSE